MSAPKTRNARIQTAQNRSGNAHDRFQLIISNDMRMSFQDGFVFMKHEINYRKIFERYIKVLDRVTSHART
ncbi:MAG: hypothetical protein PXX83_00140 [Candidatus Nitrosotalea sp.]|nr:hypothetical protein [Candidatus Nitrosotalea sp.]